MSILGPTINELYIKNEDLRLTFTIAVSNTLRGIGYNVVRNSERHTEEQIPDNETEDFQYLIGGKITKFSLNTKWTSVSDNADASVEYYIYIQKINSNDESHWFGPFNVKNKVSSAGAISPEKAARKSYVAVIDECMYTLVNNLSDIFNKE
ncbi:MAG: hypothetical protein JXA96_14215 [Sedimentisphaerales bacterium]|nr:hypothetical protein [Sedimentisphaerales bacterium]